MLTAIIGTAGRREDYNKLTWKKWIEVKTLVLRFIKDKKVTSLISGGAAFSDSICHEYLVSSENLHKDEWVLPKMDKLILCLPCEFDLDNRKFVENGPKSPGNIANYYHKKYTERMQGKRDTLSYLAEAIRLSKTEVIVGNGFLDRNKIVAEKAEMLLAITFGNKNILKDSGTSHTTNLFIKKNGNENAYHLDLNSMVIYPNAIVK